MYTLSGCPYCLRARWLLKRRGIPFREISGDGDPGFRAFLRGQTGGSTIPQILIGDEVIGGSDRLAALDRLGILTALANGRSFPVATVRRRFAWRAVPAALGSLLGGGTCGPWRHSVELRDRDGRLLDAREAPSKRAAVEQARMLNARG